MSALLSDPEFIARFHAINPPVMSFLNQAPGMGTPNQRVMDDGRSNRQFVNTAMGQAMEEKARVGAQLTQNALSTTGTFMNKPHMDVQFNRNYEVEKAHSASLFGRADSILGDIEGFIPAWLKSDGAILAMVAIIGYLAFFKSK